MKKEKPVHFIQVCDYIYMRASCDRWVGVQPKEYVRELYRYYSIGTFDTKKVTCKRCLKHPLYKEALEKEKNPLFYWKERI